MKDSIFCDCCGRGMVRCNCEWGDYWVVDRIEGGEPIESGHYESHCRLHEERFK